MKCARCKLDKDCQLFAPCMWEEGRTPGKVFCRKCSSESMGRVFGHITPSEISKEKFRFAFAEARRQEQKRHAQEHAEVKRLLELRAKRLAEMEAKKGTQ